MIATPPPKPTNDAPLRTLCVGASGHGKVLVDAASRTDEIEVVAFVDDHRPAGEEHFGLPICGKVDTIVALATRVEAAAFLLGIGDNFRRESIYQRIRDLAPKLAFPPIVHPSAVVARGVVIEEGAVVLAGAVLGPDVRIGRGAIVNTRASVDHDSVVGAFATISPGATLGGTVTIEARSVVGIGATVLQGRRVGADAVLGAGATAISDVPGRTVAYGVPAKERRTRRPGDRYL